MPIETKKIIKYCEYYLSVDKFDDGCFNGLQIEGVNEVNKVVVGVTWSKKLIFEAIKKQAKLIIVHHGLFKGDFGDTPRIKGFIKNRIKLLLENDINLAGFHLPLDTHAMIGNNVSICKILGIKKIKKFGFGFWGELDEKENFKEFVKKVNKNLHTKSYVIPAGQKKIKKIAVISGAASPHFKEAAELGVDTYICGDAREEIVRAVEETGINFINAGHYNMEKMGIQNLGKLIAKKFKIKVEFVDVPCNV